MDSHRNIEPYLSDFEVFEKSLNGEASSDVHSIRKAAITRFSELGFPTRKQEDWKYIDLSPLVDITFKLALAQDGARVSRRDIEKEGFGGTAGNRAVCVNGRFADYLSDTASLPHGILVESLAQSLKRGEPLVLRHLAQHAQFHDDSFTALNTAFLSDGIVAHIPEGVVVDEPLHFVYISTKSDAEFINHPRSLVIAGVNSRSVIVESFVNLADSTYFTNSVTEIFLDENASLEHERIQREGRHAFHVGALHVHLERNGNFVSNNINLGAALARNTIGVVLNGEGGEATLNGLYAGSGNQVIDNHTTIDHARPHCSSHELYKGILDGRSKGVFNGKIIVRKDAQKTDAKQTNKNLLLSEGATIDTKPQLEIYANDVKCTHGATTGQLDDESLFYMRSRGIPCEKAREMLIDAFANDVIERVKAEPVRSELESLLRARLKDIRSRKENSADRD